MERRKRVVKRSYAYASSGGHVVCAICLEDVSPNADFLPCVTVCDHIYHGNCWHNYCTTFSHVDDGVEVTTTDLILHFITLHAGPPCPLCRRELPGLHHLAYAVQNEELMAPIKGLRGINTDLTLTLAYETPIEIIATLKLDRWTAWEWIHEESRRFSIWRSPDAFEMVDRHCARRGWSGCV